MVVTIFFLMLIGGEEHLLMNYFREKNAIFTTLL